MAAADVVIASSPHPFTIFPAWALAKRHGAKLVFEVRDIWPLSITEMTNTPGWHPIVLLSWIAERFAMSRADLVASLLGNAEEHMRRVGMKGAFVHVPNAAPGEALVPASAPKSEHGKVADRKIKEWRAQGRTIIVHPGTQGHPSALDCLLKAIALLRERHPQHKLAVLLVGGGDTGASLQKLSTNLGLDEIIAFIPPVPKSDAVYLTGLCDIGYAGKRNFERVFKYGISFNKIIDFMQTGLPVILPVTTKGDPVSSSGCGIVTGDDPAAIAEGIRRMLEMHPEERSEMGKRGTAYLKSHLSYGKVAANYITAIEGA